MDTSVLVLIVIVVIVGFGVIAVGSLTKSKWGINMSTVRCPNCQTIQPRVRTPTDAYEFKWGGATCTNCGTKMDKWGRLRN